MNKTNKNILDFLRYYCRHTNALQYAVLLNGAWGSGKTHLVTKFLEEEKDIETIYVSLYGMKDVSDIEDAFFAKLHPMLSSKGMKVAGAVLKGMLRGGLKLDWEALDKVKAGIDGKPFDVGVPEFLKKAKGKVLVFDDLERSEMPLRKLMGFINSLVEHDDAKVILIANEDEIIPRERKGYLKTKEKLVGKTFEIEVDFAAAVEAFVSSIEDADIKQFLTAKRQKLETIFRQSRTNNLRILQQSLWDFERLAAQLAPSHRKNIDAMDAIFGPFISLFFELRAARLSIDDLIGFDEINWAKYFRREKGEKSRGDEIQERYPEIRYERSIIGVDVLSDALFRSALDAEVIKLRVDQSPFFAKPADVPSWKVLWNHLSYSDADVETAFADMENRFKAREYTVPGLLMHVFGLRIWLAEIKKLPQAKVGVLAECKAYIDDLYVSKRLPIADTNRRFDYDMTGYEGLSYHGKDTSEFKAVIAYMEKKRRRALEDGYPGEAAALLNTMAKDPDEFFRALTQGQQGIGRFVSIPILKYADPAEFVVKLLTLSKDQMRTALCAFKPRYEHIFHYKALVPELRWLKKIENLLLKEARAREPIGRADLESTVQWAITRPRKEAEGTVAAFPKSAPAGEAAKIKKVPKRAKKARSS
jgi:hypothetical protein